MTTRRTSGRPGGFSRSSSQPTRATTRRPILIPEPVEHCAICRWNERCADRRRRDDDLSLIAGITAGQRRALKAAGRDDQARASRAWPSCPSCAGVSRASLASAQAQARLQVASEDAGRIRVRATGTGTRRWRARWCRTGGCWRFPSRSPVTCSSTSREPGTTPRTARSSGCSTCSASSTRPTPTPRGAPRYTQIWAFDRQEEKRAFEELVDFITDRRKRHPWPARLPLQPLRADGDRSPHRTARDPAGSRRPADGPVRDPRGRGR